jgi:hypothetical protein
MRTAPSRHVRWSTSLALIANLCRSAAQIQPNSTLESRDFLLMSAIALVASKINSGLPEPRMNRPLITDSRGLERRIPPNLRVDYSLLLELNGWSPFFD